MLPKKGGKRLRKKLEWRIVEPNSKGKINCLDCSKSFNDMKSAKQHYKDDHMTKKKFVCKVCKQCYWFEDYLKLHMRSAHMLPKLLFNKSSEKFEWKLVTPNEDGRFTCLDCPKTFSMFYSAKTHHEQAHRSKTRFICNVCK